ncbi:flagellar export chaperone FliS [Zooshikella harenae]|nr:flagellar export chaperone FliS [Zooshikella harenae]
MNAMNQLQQYQSVNRETGVIDADPHKLIQMLYDGLIERLATARGFILRQDFEAKNVFINKSIEILEGLRSFLDHDQGGELAANLDNLYQYMELQLFNANADNDADKVDEVIKLVKTVKDGWDEIRSEVMKS